MVEKMSFLEKIKESIDNGSIKGQEIWLFQDEFWCFLIDEDRVICTDGYSENGELIYVETSILAEGGVTPENIVGELVEEKLQQGFQCGAMLV